MAGVRVDVEQTIDADVPAVLTSVGDGALAEFGAAGVVVEQRPEGLRPVERIVALDEHSPVTDGCGQPAHSGGDDGRARSRRLDRDEPEGLAVRRHRNDVGRVEPPNERAAVDGRHEVDDVLDAEVAGQGLQRERLVEAGT